MILKILISVIFVAAVVQKFTGKVAPSWERWGYSRQFMYATGIAELLALALFWVAAARTRGCGRALSGAAWRSYDPDQAPRRTVPHRFYRVHACAGSGAFVPVNRRITC